MFRKLFLGLALCLVASSAFAWSYSEGSDQMTDEPTAWIYSVSSDTGFGILIKCWRDSDRTLNLFVRAPMRYDDAANYDVDSLDVRIDREKPFTLSVEKKKFNDGALVLLAVDKSDFLQVLRARNRVVVGAFNSVLEFPVGIGDPNAVERLLNRCGLNLTN